jgi:hypothetical protein
MAAPPCGFRQNNGKFFSAVSGQEIRIPQKRFDAADNFFQAKISNGMTEPVVEVLEMIHIQYQHGENIMISVIAFQLLCDALVIGPAIVGTG